MSRNRRPGPGASSPFLDGPPSPHQDHDAWRVEDWRAEHVSALAALEGLPPGVSFFGSARVPPSHPLCPLVRDLAGAVGRLGYAVITGSGDGFMAAANQGARQAGAPSVGLGMVLPRQRESNPYVDHAVLFRHFPVRKAVFVRHSVGYVVAPGGFGTLDELFEVVTLAQTGKLRPPPVVLLGTGHWAPLLAWLRESVVGSGMVEPAELDLLSVADTVPGALRALALNPL